MPGISREFKLYGLSFQECDVVESVNCADKDVSDSYIQEVNDSRARLIVSAIKSRAPNSLFPVSPSGRVFVKAPNTTVSYASLAAERARLFPP
jgi:hypothetical protein